MREEQMNLFDFMQPEAEQKTCESCIHFFHYTCGMGGIYKGTACRKNAPLSERVEPDKPACNDWKEKKHGKGKK